MQVANVMDRRFQYLSGEKPIWVAQELMLRRNLNYLVISATGETLEGLVTHADVFRRVLPTTAEFMEKADFPSDPELVADRYTEISSQPVESIMTTRLTTVSPSMPVVQAGALMNAKKIKQLPVVEDSRLVGIVSYTDVSAGLLFISAGRLLSG